MKPARALGRPFHVVAEPLEARRLFDMVYPGPQGPLEYDPAHQEEMPAEYVLGSKWSQPAGLGSAVNLSYSFSNLLDGAVPGGLSAITLETAVEEALQVWSAVAPLKFTEVVDSGPAPSDSTYSATGRPQLRFGHHYIDGQDGPNTLAHAYYPSTSGLGGDLHFDNGNTWSTSPLNGIDILEVATHEIGHALGIQHEDANEAIMNPYYGGRFSGLGSAFLLQDDVNAIQAQYGAGLGYVVSDGTLYLSGTESADAMSFDVGSSSFTLTRGGATATASLAGITQVVINPRGGNDTITINNTASVGVVVNGGGGNDTLVLDGSASLGLGAIAAAVGFDGGAGSDAVILNDRSTSFAGTYTIAAGSVTRGDGFGGMTYNSVSALTLSGSESPATFDVVSTSVATPVTLRTGGGADDVNLNADAVGTASILFDQPDETLGALTIGAGGSASLSAAAAPAAHALTLESLTIAAAGKLDLHKGALLINYPASDASPAGLIPPMIRDGRLARGAVGVDGSTLYALGSAEARDLLGLAPGQSLSWRGHTLDDTTFVVRFTYAGDATLDGRINIDDYGRIDFNAPLAGAAGYYAGDFNYDDVINIDDYGLIDFNALAQTAVL